MGAAAKQASASIVAVTVGEHTLTCCTQTGLAQLSRRNALLGRGVWRGSYVLYYNERDLAWRLLDKLEQQLRRVLRSQHPQIWGKDFHVTEPHIQRGAIRFMFEE